METNIILTLLFGGILPTISLISGITIFRARLKIKATQKALGAVAHHIPPELAAAAGTAVGGPAGGVAASAGLSVLQNMDTNNKLEHKQQHNKNIKWNSHSNNITDKYSQQQEEYKPGVEKEKEKNKRKTGLLSGIGKTVGGATYMGGELGKIGLEKGVRFAGKKIKAGVETLDNMYGIKTGAIVMGVRAKKKILGTTQMIGKKVFKPAKRIANEKIWQPIKKIAGKIHNSKPIKSVRGVVRKTGKSIAKGYDITKNTAKAGVKTVKDKYNDLMAWKKRMTDPEQSPLIQRVKGIIEKGAHLRGRIETYADDNTKGYGIMQEGIEEIREARKQRKEEKEAKKNERKAERKAKKEEEKANGSNIVTRVAQKFRPQARYTTVPQQPVLIINNANSTPNTNVKVNITDANLNNLYNFNNTHYKVAVNPLKGTDGLLAALMDPKNFGMSANQIRTYQIAKKRITERESDYGSKLPEGYYLEEKLRYLKNAIKMAPGLTAEQATLVTEKAIEARRKREDEKRRNAIIETYNSRDYVEEKRRAIETMVVENPEYKEKLDKFINESYEDVQLSKERTAEIQAQVEQYYNGEIPDFGNEITSEELEIIVRETDKPEDQAKVIEEKLKEQAKKDSVREQTIKAISEAPTGTVAHEVFSSSNFQEELTEKIKANEKTFQKEITKKIEEDRSKQIEQIKKEEGVTFLEAASIVEAKEQQHYIEQAIKEVAPNVEIKQTPTQVNHVAKQHTNEVSQAVISQPQTANNDQEPIRQPGKRKSNKASKPLLFEEYAAQAESRKKKLSPTESKNNERNSVARQPILFEENADQIREGQKNKFQGQSKPSSLELQNSKQKKANPSSTNIKIFKGKGTDAKSIIERNRKNSKNFDNAG